MSNLYWRTGSGYFSFISFFLFLFLGYYMDSFMKFIFIILACLLFVFILYRYYMWNGTPWRKVHFRSMRLYASLAGEETGRAKFENREFDIVNPCRQLAYKLVGYGKESEANDVVDYLFNEQGYYYAGILTIYLPVVFPDKINADTISSLVDHVIESVKFGPQMVICKVIENTFGAEEATRYIIAQIKGEAI